MNIVPNIIGYHTNDEHRCEMFVEKGVPINHADVFYFGRGMYFWDNLSNAKYWVKQKIRKNKDQTICKWWIVRVNINVSSVLDLTDEIVLESVNNLWKTYCQKKNCNPKEPLGKKIDILFDYFGVLSVYTVVKGNVEYKGLSVAEFLNDTFVVNKIKCIYSVRCENSILTRFLEEVINNEPTG